MHNEERVHIDFASEKPNHSYEKEGGTTKQQEKESKRGPVRQTAGYSTRTVNQVKG